MAGLLPIVQSGSPTLVCGTERIGFYRFFAREVERVRVATADTAFAASAASTRRAAWRNSASSRAR